METSDKIDPKNFEAMPNQYIKSDAVIFWSKFGFDIQPIDPLTLKLSSFDEDSPQSHFEQFPNHVPAAKLPPGFIAVTGSGASFMAFVQSINCCPMAWFRNASPEISLYRIDESSLPVKPHVPNGIKLQKPGEIIMLPFGDELVLSKLNAKTLDELEIITNISIFDRADHDDVTPVAIPSLLEPYSLRGKSGDIRENIVELKPLLDRLALGGQMTIWFGPANAGKSLMFMALISMAISDNRISGNDVFYINADDSGEGLATKTELLEDIGCHTLAPGYSGFELDNFEKLITNMSKNGQAKGKFLILDTAKKFVDPMNKTASVEFGKICRSFIMSGGTILLLAHTNKNLGVNGKEQYAGTADLLQDCDAAYIIDVLRERPSEKVIEFTNKKRRGDSIASQAYIFDNKAETPYDQRLASIEPIQQSQIDSFKLADDVVKDSEIIEALQALISNGPIVKMDLARLVAEKVPMGRNKIIAIIDKYQGDDPSKDLWYFKVGLHNRKTYFLHEAPPTI